jgi:hypothetical protein
MQYSVNKLQNFKNVSTDRVFKLKPIEGSPLSSRGITDKRLFTGDNNLHAIQDAGLWFLKYDDGSVPPALKQRFTNFNQLLKYVTNYYRIRNVEIIEILD